MGFAEFIRVLSFQKEFAILLNFEARFSYEREKGELIFESVSIRLITSKMCVILQTA